MSNNPNDYDDYYNDYIEPSVNHSDVTKLYIYTVEFYNHKHKRHDVKKFSGYDENKVMAKVDSWVQKSVHCEVIDEYGEWK